jgi:hypothetical protein
MGSIIKFGRIAIGDVLGKHYPGAPEDHLLAAEAWLCRAQDASADGGVCYGFHYLVDGAHLTPKLPATLRRPSPIRHASVSPRASVRGTMARRHHS